MKNPSDQELIDEFAEILQTSSMPKDWAKNLISTFLNLVDTRREISKLNEINK